ncbi:hypothetical protein BG004_006612 [Podila humilis]|nr:hypothetical protein BG004_006612 [Podila humilis]
MSGPKDPVDGLTTRHVLYLVFMHMIGAMILDGSINFGLATAMYKGTKDPISIWPLPNTLAGDAAVTIIIQTTLTWILDRLAVGGDLKKGLVAPLRMPINAKPWLRWFIGLDELKSFQQSSKSGGGGGGGGGGTSGATVGTGAVPGVPHYYSRKEKVLFLLAFHGKRIAVMIVATFIVFWPITIGILTGLRNQGIGRDHSDLGGDFNVWPMPEIFKGIYGFAVGITTPFVSYVALIYQGETMTKIDNREYAQVQNSDDDDDTNSVTVVMEDLQQERA